MKNQIIKLLKKSIVFLLLFSILFVSSCGNTLSPMDVQKDWSIDKQEEADIYFPLYIQYVSNKLSEYFPSVSYTLDEYEETYDEDSKGVLSDFYSDDNYRMCYTVDCQLADNVTVLIKYRYCNRIPEQSDVVISLSAEFESDEQFESQKDILRTFALLAGDVGSFSINMHPSKEILTQLLENYFAQEGSGTPIDYWNHTSNSVYNINLEWDSGLAVFGYRNPENLQQEDHRIRVSGYLTDAHVLDYSDTY